VNVGITGASGFIGRALVNGFASSGWTVTHLGRRETRRYDLAEPVDPQTLVDLDAVVHAAYDSGADNVAAMKRLIRAVRAARVPTFVFISSFASNERAASRYGRDKYMAERALDLTTDMVVRPGLVVGHGGLYGTMQRTIRRWGIAPVFGDGRQPVYLVGVDELTRAIVTLVDHRATGVFSLAASEPMAFADLCAAIGTAAGHRVRYLKIPIAGAIAVTAVAEYLGLRLPISSESVRGVKSLRTVSVPKYPEIGFLFSSPAATVDHAEGEFR
jgi:nucleoside-diphosphate-sugar epimerase